MSLALEIKEKVYYSENRSLESILQLEIIKIIRFIKSRVTSIKVESIDRNIYHNEHSPILLTLNLANLKTTGS